MSLLEVAKQAQAELERIRDAMLRNVSASYTNLDAAITALRAAIESAEKLEPVAWIYRGGADVPPCDDGFHPWHLSVGPDRPHLAWRHQELRPLYTHPPAAPAITEWTTEAITYLTKTKEGVVFRNVIEMPAHAVEWKLENPPTAVPAITDEMVTAAARALSALNAAACGTDPIDTWKIYGDDFKCDARAALEAALKEK